MKRDFDNDTVGGTGGTGGFHTVHNILCLSNESDGNYEWVFSMDMQVKKGVGGNAPCVCRPNPNGTVTNLNINIIRIVKKITQICQNSMHMYRYI